MRRGRRALLSLLSATALVTGGLVALLAGPAGATSVSDETSLRNAFGDPTETQIDLTNDITLSAASIYCVASAGLLLRSSTTPLVVDGHGFTITQQCPNFQVMQLIQSGSLDLRNITLTGGTQNVGNGGGIDSRAGGAVLLTSSTVTGNMTGGAGGGINATGPVTLTDSSVSHNTATTGIGGGIASGTGVTMTRSTVDSNHSGDSGGGIHTGGTLTITDSTVSGNTAVNDAGGAFGGGGATVTGSTFSGNSASIGGGLHFDTHGAVTNSTISGNTGSTSAGGVLGDASLTLQYTTIAGNVAGSGGANIQFRGRLGALTSFGSVVALPSGAVNCILQGTTTSNGYNWDDDGTCGFGSGPGDHSNAGDPQLGALGNNGGPTQTRAPVTGSGLLDQIPAASPCGGVNIVVDQRGLPRPVTAGQFCDVGAVELQVAVPAAAVGVTPRFAG